LIPAPFEYHRPQSLQEAIGLLAQHGEDARVVAGGHSLVALRDRLYCANRTAPPLNPDLIARASTPFAPTQPRVDRSINFGGRYDKSGDSTRH